MTDLVQKLVVALEECLDDSRSVLADMEQKYGTNYRQDRLEFHRQVIADAEAALSEAKAGGWVAVPVEPTQAMLDAADKVQDGCNFGLDDIYKAMLAARPLPAPPAQKDPT